MPVLEAEGGEGLGGGGEGGQVGGREEGGEQVAGQAQVPSVHGGEGRGESWRGMWTIAVTDVVIVVKGEGEAVEGKGGGRWWW